MPPEAVLSGRRTEFDAALLIRPVAGRARALPGSLLHAPTEAALRAAQTLELVITLVGDEWAPEVGRQATAADRAVARALIDGIRPSATSRRRRGRRSSAPRSAPSTSRARTDVTVTVSVPPLVDYDIVSPETLSVHLPAVALRSRESVLATPRLRVLASNGTLVLGGSLLEAPTEATVTRAGAAPVIRVDLQQDAWVDALGTYVAANATAGTAAVGDGAAAMAATSALVAGLKRAGRAPRLERDRAAGARRGAHPPPRQRVARDRAARRARQLLDHGARDRRAHRPRRGPRLGPPGRRAVAAHDPADAGAGPPVELARRQQLGGRRAGRRLAAHRHPPRRRVGAERRPARLGAADSLTQAVLASFVSAQSEDSGWNAIVRQALQYTDISYVDGASVTLELPPFPAYDLLKAETISVNLPAVAVASGQEVFAGIPRGDALDALQISANTGTCSMSGTLFGNANETTLRSELAYTIVVTLTGDSWTRDVGQFDASGEGASAQLLRGFTSLQSEELGWNAIVRPAAPGEPERGIPQTNVERTSDTTVTITVDQFAAYDITAPETVELVVPQIAVSSAQNVPCKAFLVLPITGSASLSGRLVEAPSEAEVSLRRRHHRAAASHRALRRRVGRRRVGARHRRPRRADERGARVERRRPAGAHLRQHDGDPPRRRHHRRGVRAGARGYEITTPETLVVTLPASTVASKQRRRGARRRPRDRREPVGRRASGSVHLTAEEATLRRAQGHSLVVTLSADAFVPSIMLPGDASEAFLAGINGLRRRCTELRRRMERDRPPGARVHRRLVERDGAERRRRRDPAVRLVRRHRPRDDRRRRARRRRRIEPPRAQARHLCRPRERGPSARRRVPRRRERRRAARAPERARRHPRGRRVAARHRPAERRHRRAARRPRRRRRRIVDPAAAQPAAAAAAAVAATRLATAVAAAAVTAALAASAVAAAALAAAALAAPVAAAALAAAALAAAALAAARRSLRSAVAAAAAEHLRRHPTSRRRRRRRRRPRRPRRRRRSHHRRRRPRCRRCRRTSRRLRGPSSRLAAGTPPSRRRCRSATCDTTAARRSGSRSPPSPRTAPQLAEDITATVPAAAVVSGRTVEAESRVRVSASGRSARLTGALLARPDEGSVRSEGANLTVTLSGDEWVRPLTPSLAALVLAGLTSEQGEPLGWNAALANATAAGGVGVALDADDGATVLHIEVPALRDYDISSRDDRCWSCRRRRSAAPSTCAPT